jgi:hypothetical protein
MGAGALRLVIVLLAIAAVLGVAVAAGTPAHSHGKLTCSICAAAHHSVDQAGDAIQHLHGQTVSNV